MNTTKKSIIQREALLHHLNMKNQSKHLLKFANNHLKDNNDNKKRSDMSNLLSNNNNQSKDQFLLHLQQKKGHLHHPLVDDSTSYLIQNILKYISQRIKKNQYLSFLIILYLLLKTSLYLLLLFIINIFICNFVLFSSLFKFGKISHKSWLSNPIHRRFFKFWNTKIYPIILMRIDTY